MTLSFLLKWVPIGFNWSCQIRVFLKCEIGDFILFLCRREKASLLTFKRGHAMQVIIQKGGILRKLAPFFHFGMIIPQPTMKEVMPKLSNKPTKGISNSHNFIIHHQSKHNPTFLSKTSLYHKIAKESVLCVFVCAMNFVEKEESEFIVTLSHYDIVLKFETVFCKLFWLQLCKSEENFSAPLLLTALF